VVRGQALAFVAATVVVLSSAACGHRVGETERRQAQNRARLAASMLMEGEFADALREARRAVDLDPDCIDGRLTLATIYAARAEFDRAETELQEVLRRDEGNPFAQNTLATVYMNMGRPAEAEPLARSAAENEDYSGRHLAYYNWGWALFERQSYAAALEAFGQALREAPGMCLAHYRIGDVYFRERRFEDALRHLEQAVQEPEEEETPSTPQAQREQPTCAEMPQVHHVLGLALMASGRDADAEGAFRRCVELAPEASDLRRQCAQRIESPVEDDGADDPVEDEQDE